MVEHGFIAENLMVFTAVRSNKNAHGLPLTNGKIRQTNRQNRPYIKVSARQLKLFLRSIVI